MNKRSLVIYFLTIVLFSLTGCSDVEKPANIEPTISVGEASEITRHEALVSAIIKSHGGETPSQIRIRYGTNVDMDLISEALTIDSEIISFKLTELTPGREYYFRAEALRGTTIIKSNTSTFKTCPNEVPSLSDTAPLSRGPIGIIIGFSITDDGGEQIIDAGCILSDINTEEKSIIHLTQEHLSPGHHTLYVKVPDTDKEYIITPFASNSIGTTFGNPIDFTPSDAIFLQNAGNLQLLLDNYEYRNNKIVIAGEMNGDDFRYLRGMLGSTNDAEESSKSQTLEIVDITNADILEGGKSYDGSRFTITNTISTGLFADCRSLVEISLPITATTLSTDAFYGCGNLATLTIPPGITDLHPSSNCESLKEINVSPGNACFASIDGVVCNKDLTEIVWFPQAREGEYNLPSGVTSISDHSFKEARIEYVTLPESLVRIGKAAFSKALIHKISLPDNIETIPESLFQNCGLLESVVLGKSTAYIGNYVFENCPIQDLYITSEFPPVVFDRTFGINPTYIYENCNIHVMKKNVTLYRNHPIWGKFKHISEI